MPALNLVLPDKEDEQLAIDTIPYYLSTFDTALSLSEIAGATGLAFEVSAFGLSVGGAVVGQWFALGSGYAEAWEHIRADREPMGFAYGVVMGSDGRSARLTASWFGETNREKDYADRTSGVVAQKAFNTGLKNGWVQGHVLTPNQRAIFWRDLVSRAGYKDKISGEETKTKWGDPQWKWWYGQMGIAFRKYHML